MPTIHHYKVYVYESRLAADRMSPRSPSRPVSALPHVCHEPKHRAQTTFPSLTVVWACCSTAGTSADVVAQNFDLLRKQTGSCTLPNLPVDAGLAALSFMIPNILANPRVGVLEGRYPLPRHQRRTGREFHDTTSFAKSDCFVDKETIIGSLPGMAGFFGWQTIAGIHGKARISQASVLPLST